MTLSLRVPKFDDQILLDELQKKYKNIPREQLKDYDQFHIYEENGSFYHKNKSITNFVMTPITSIRNEENNTTIFLYRINNTEKKDPEKLLQLNADNLVSSTSFKKALLNQGYYVWRGVKADEFNDLFEMLNKKMRRSTEITRLFWQKEYGFWAWANGISTTDGEFIPCDNTGLVLYKGKYFFIRAASDVRINEASNIEFEKQLTYSEKSDNAPTLKKWGELMVKVYENEAVIAIAYMLTAVFSDYIFHVQKSLPLLALIGQPGSGKTKLAGSIINPMYSTSKLTPVALNNSTAPGFGDQLMLMNNGIIFLEEFKNELSGIQTLIRDIYNRYGRTRAQTKDLKTPKITSMVVLAGEQYPNDKALVERIIPLYFSKTEFTPEESALFHSLKEIEQTTFTYFISELLKYRNDIVTNYKSTSNEIRKALRQSLSSLAIEDRIIENYATIISVFKIINDRADIFSFGTKKLMRVAVELIENQNKILNNVGITSNFWTVLEHQHKEYKLPEKQFLIELVTEITLKSPSGKEEYTKRFIEDNKPELTNIVLLKWPGLYAQYKIGCKSLDLKPVDENTLKRYLRSSKECIGQISSKRIGGGVYSVLVFEYSKLNVDLIRD